MIDPIASDRAAPSVKSQPVYVPLCVDPAARRHIVVGEPAGLEVVLRIVETVAGSGVPVEVYWLGTEPERLRGWVPVYAFDSVAVLGQALAQHLRTVGMGLRLYLAGREAFLWQVNLWAREAGLREDEIQREACGSKARRVFCVHCRHVFEEVTTNPVACPSCGVLLEVRDHFSRALAAYIGVVINAEDALDAPEPQEQFV